MITVKVKKEGSAQLFRSHTMELLTRTNPLLHVFTYGGAVLFFLLKNEQALGISVMLFLSGIFTWTLMEYLMHRYVFHIRFERLQYMIHGVHHEFPRDKERLLMPPVPGIILLSLFFGLYYIMLREYTFAFFAGLVSGYMCYTFLHYVIHTWKPIKGLKFLWTHHHKHHNPVYGEKAFGVSTTLWDHIFGTMPVKPAGARDEDAR